MLRRHFLLTSLSLPVCSAGVAADLGTSADSKMILPQGSFKRIEPQGAGRAATSRTTSAIAPPWGYVTVAAEYAIPAWAMYGVALQESQMKFGERVLPFPWTLCVRGRAERYSSYRDTLAALTRHVKAGITNVDCGSMQVNWHWHKDKFDQDKAAALNYWTNLRVGASILASLNAQHRNWHTAFKLYHTGSETAANRSRGNRYAGAVIARLQRLGVDTHAVLGVRA
ncbi:lytic transglycosylase domain-containing protein [Lampropedia puyangensis]|uniref:Lytic transglycosylase domain-containing protein n=1 Tax=Lampropedia puyangensis TaxID=1330072 RepID=A0A4S8EVA2_9BURK|nr:lytic transglycosylase domain-containing protein [Lampropedia puyangensis]THT98398.1 lytic transglycosylase domain-containing protein [Lampropedia puyangensis]